MPEEMEQLGVPWEPETADQSPNQVVKLHLYRPHRGQAPLHRSKARFRIATCGRRFGKTWAAVNEIAAAAWERPNQVTWWVAPTFDITQIGFALLRKSFAPVITDVSLSARRVEWRSGSVTYFRSAQNWPTLVGEGLTFLVIDEAGRVDERAWTESLRPTLADKKGRVLIIGTPKGKNWFYHIWMMGKGQDPDYQSWQFPTSMNPAIDPKEVEQARRTLPTDVFRQEWEAAWLDRNAGVFRNIDSCVKEYSLPVPREEGLEYYAGLDLARLQDFTVLTILDSKRRLVYWDRWNQMDWSMQIERVAYTVKKYGAMLTVDATGVGDPIFEALERSGLDVQPFKFTNQSKKELIELLCLPIERGEMTFPQLHDLLHELEIMEYDLGPSGTVKYSAPPGFHDDCVISLALANWGLERSPQGPLVRWL